MSYINKTWNWDFPGGPVFTPSNSGTEGSIPSQGAKIQKKQNIKQKQDCNKFNKEFKNGSHKKKNLKQNKQKTLESNKMDPSTELV